MNYKQAMKSPDAEKWVEEVANEKARFDKYRVLTPVPRDKLKVGAEVLTTTWAMKKKTNGKFCGRLNARGYEQVDGDHFVSDSIASPVTNPNTVRMVLTLLYMNPKWVAVILDVCNYFLCELKEQGLYNQTCTW